MTWQLTYFFHGKLIHLILIFTFFLLVELQELLQNLLVIIIILSALLWIAFKVEAPQLRWTGSPSGGLQRHLPSLPCHGRKLRLAAQVSSCMQTHPEDSHLLLPIPHHPYTHLHFTPPTTLLQPGSMKRLRYKKKKYIILFRSYFQLRSCQSPCLFTEQSIKLHQHNTEEQMTRLGKKQTAIERDHHCRHTFF